MFRCPTNSALHKANVAVTKSNPTTNSLYPPKLNHPIKPYITCYVYITRKNNIIITTDKNTIMMKFRFPPDFWINSFVFRVTRLRFSVAVSKSSSISLSILKRGNDERAWIVCQMHVVLLSQCFMLRVSTCCIHDLQIDTIAMRATGTRNIPLNPIITFLSLVSRLIRINIISTHPLDNRSRSVESLLFRV